MTIVRWGSALLVLVCWTASARPADLTKIERIIAKEPNYQSSPKYCLLVFGPEATTRIWLVLDGNGYYLDRNGNGDLTDDQRQEKGSYSTNLGPIVDADGKTNHGDLRVYQYSNRTRMLLSKGGRRRQFVGWDYQDRLSFADRPQDSPIAHFGGPLQLRLFGRRPSLVPGQNNRFNIALGTPGIGKGSFVALDCCSLPEGVTPRAEIAFPHRNPKEKPIRKVYLIDGD